MAPDLAVHDLGVDVGKVANDTVDAPAVDGDPKVELLLTITGGGRVTSTASAALDCFKSCRVQLPRGTAIDLIAEGTLPDQLYQWGGACTGRQRCSFTLDRNVAVSLTFRSPEVWRRPVIAAATALFADSLFAGRAAIGSFAPDGSIPMDEGGRGLGVVRYDMSTGQVVWARVMEPLLGAPSAMAAGTNALIIAETSFPRGAGFDHLGNHSVHFEELGYPDADLQIHRLARHSDGTFYVLARGHKGDRSAMQVSLSDWAGRASVRWTLSAWGSEIAVDRQGNAILCGGLQEGPLVTEPQIPGGAPEIPLNGSAILAKLHATGGFAWVKPIVGLSNGECSGLGLDREGDVYLAARGLIDRRATTVLMKAAGVDGRLLWERNLGPSGAFTGTNIVANGDASVLLTYQETPEDSPGVSPVTIAARLSSLSGARISSLRLPGKARLIGQLPGGDLAVEYLGEGAVARIWPP